MLPSTREKQRIAYEMKHVRIAMPKKELASLSEDWPKAKLRKRKMPMHMTDAEVDQALALPDPPDCWDDAYDGAY